MKGYDIPVFWNTDETRQREDMGLDVPLEDCIEKVMVFYQISCLSSYDDKYCKIYSGGEVFFSPLSVMEIKLMLTD